MTAGEHRVIQEFLRRLSGIVQPRDILKAPDVFELDLRFLPPCERHSRIFEVGDSLRPGQSLRLISDHDPKPLHCQSDAEQTGKFAWTYEERGPLKKPAGPSSRS